MQTVEMVHQVGVVDESRRDVLVILDELITRLHGESLQHLQMTELVCSTQAILHVLPCTRDALHVVLSTDLSVQRLGHLWRGHGVLHAVHAVQSGALGVQGLAHVGEDRVRGVGPGLRQEQLVRLQVRSLRLRRGLNGLYGDLAQLAQGGVLH